MRETKEEEIQELADRKGKTEAQTWTILLSEGKGKAASLIRLVNSVSLAPFFHSGWTRTLASFTPPTTISLLCSSRYRSVWSHGLLHLLSFFNCKDGLLMNESELLYSMSHSFVPLQLSQWNPLPESLPAWLILSQKTREPDVTPFPIHSLSKINTLDSFSSPSTYLPISFHSPIDSWTDSLSVSLLRFAPLSLKALLTGESMNAGIQEKDSFTLYPDPTDFTVKLLRSITHLSFT